jgi:hypothetical protein
MPSDLAQRIRAAVLKSLSARNRYTDQVTVQLTRSLDQAEKEVAKAILKYRTLGSLPDNKLAALKGLEKLQAELDDIIKRLKREQTLVFKKSTGQAFTRGISQGIEELTVAALPFYADLTPAGIDKLATKVFSIIDTNALDFMVQYNLTLAGDVQRELADGIKRVIMQGIVAGKSTDDIVRDLGKVVLDKDSFRQATEFSTTNYERAYHFVEGLMTYWDGLEIKKDTKVKYYKTDHQTVTKGNANEFFRTFLGNAGHIRLWLISYRDHAYPNEQEMRKIIGSLGKQSRMQSKDHHYAITSRHGDASNAKERLFICVPASKAKVDEQSSEKPVPLAAAANFHTSIPVKIRIAESEALSAAALDAGTAGDPQFSFILCRTGTNKNGDHFTVEELSSRHMTAVNKKIDLQHSQEFNDIVGGVVAADYLEDDSGGRVECVGELYVNDTPAARLAYKLIKRGIISQVSMECDYEEGECSVCKKRFTNKADYCPHLRKFKGREYNGRLVHEILHGVTFTGLGLLDRKGADENARILQVASETRNAECGTRNSQNSKTQSEKGDSTMTDKTKTDKDPSKSDTDAAKKKPEEKAPTRPSVSPSWKRKAGSSKPRWPNCKNASRNWRANKRPRPAVPGPRSC